MARVVSACGSAARAVYELATARTRSRPAWRAGDRLQVLENGGYRCRHCKTLLGLDQAWDMDHFPVPWRDIEDQCCCGVTNGRDLSNVVPACKECNRTHRYERKGVWCFCGRTQHCCCRRSYGQRALWTCLGVCLGSFATAIVASVV